VKSSSRPFRPAGARGALHCDGVSLEALAKQSGVEFVYEVQQLKGLRTKGVHGVLTPENAVAKLLEGTALTVTKHPSGAVLISAPSAVSRSDRGSLEGEGLRLSKSASSSVPRHQS